MPRAQNSDALVGQRLDRLIAALLGASGPELLFQTSCSLCREITGAVGACLLSRDAGKVGLLAVSPALPNAGPGSEAPAESPAWLRELARVYSQVLAATPQALALTGDHAQAHAVFVPIVQSEGNGQSLALAAYVTGSRSTRLQSVLDVMQLLRGVILLVDKQARGQSAQETSTAKAGAEGDNALRQVIDILAEVQSSGRFMEAAMTFCAEVAGKTGCRRVALGQVRAASVKTLAVSQMESFNRGTRMVRAMEEAMQECLDQGRIIFYSTHEEENARDGAVTRASAELASMAGVRRVLALPLRGKNGIRFIALFLPDQEELPPTLVDSLCLVSRLVTPRLEDLKDAEDSFIRKAWRQLQLFSADIFGPRRTVLKLAGAILGVLLFASLIFKGDLEISAPLVIEGVHSYTHTAPMDSYLLEVHVRPGDEVKKGALMGRLDATEIRLEIAALEAQLSIHRNQSFQLMQEGKHAEAAIAGLEAEKDEANLSWARTRLAMTELRSSVDGFIVSEDMYPRLGQPVRRGQELFEVTDTASMRAVAHVEEGDISDIAASLAQEGGASGEFTLTAYPDTRIELTVERIHPFATVQGEINGFEVRCDISGATQGIALKPGMEGYAHIKAGREPLLFLWTRKLANRLKLLWWKWS